MSRITRTAVASIAAALGVALALGGCTTTSGGGAVAEDCEPAHDVTTMEEGVLTVAAYDYPPFVRVDGNVLTGAEGEVMMKIAEMECLELRVMKGDGAAVIESVRSGRADVTLGSFYRTEARAEIVRLGAPIIETTLAMVSTLGVDTIDELEGLRIGAADGFLANEDLRRLFGDNLKTYQSVSALYQDLAAGRIDVAMSGVGPAIAELELHPVEGAEIKIPQPDDRVPATQNPGQTNFIVSYENEELGEAMDEDIAEIRESGLLEEIVVRYGFPEEAAHPGEPNLL